MSDLENIGISKIARQKVIDQLKHAYAKDYLEQDDFEKRITLAMRTQKRSDLAALIDDLPDEHEEKALKLQNAGTPAMDATGLRINRGAVDPSDTLVAIFSGVTRRGDWRPSKNLHVVSVMGGADLDFTNAYIPAEGIEITCFALMGGVDIRVPAGVNVKTTGFAFMGGFDNHAGGEIYPGMPTITISGFAFMGGVDIRGPRKKGLFKKIINKMIGE